MTASPTAAAGPTPTGVANPTPESMFRISGLDRTLRRTGPLAGGPALRMRTGDWMLDADGLACSGALGVLLDDAAGQQVFLSRRDLTQVSVTSELSLDVLVPPPWAGPELSAHGWVEAADGTGAFTQVRAHDGEGRLVAVATNWGRFVTLGSPVTGEVPAHLGPEPGASLRVADLLGAVPVATGEDTASLGLDGDPRLANPMGMVHGGIVACAAERTAAAAVDRPGWWAASLRVHYLRPTPLEPGVRLSATVSHRTRSLAVVRVLTRSAAGRVSSEANLTFRRPA